MNRLADAACFSIALSFASDVGQKFDEARNVVADVFASEFQIEALSLGNMLPTEQCSGAMFTASKDGKAIIVWLNRPRTAGTPTVAQGTDIYGIYVNPDDHGEYLELREDGTFLLRENVGIYLSQRGQ